MKPITLPPWFNRLPDNAYIDAKELRELFGYSPNTTLAKLVQSGILPEPDCRHNGFSRPTYCSKNRLKWNVGNLRAFIKEQRSQHTK